MHCIYHKVLCLFVRTGEIIIQALSFASIKIDDKFSGRVLFTSEKHRLRETYTTLYFRKHSGYIFITWLFILSYQCNGHKSDMYLTENCNTSFTLSNSTIICNTQDKGWAANARQTHWFVDHANIGLISHLSTSWKQQSIYITSFSCSWK